MAATVVITDPTPPELLVERLREHGSERRRLRARLAELEAANRTLADRARALELELALARMNSGEVAPPSTIDNRFTAEIWLAWARTQHHTEACACHRCRAARTLL